MEALGVKAFAPPDQHVEIEVVAIVGPGSKWTSVPARMHRPESPSVRGGIDHR
jgi:hypothetical protein